MPRKHNIGNLPSSSVFQINDLRDRLFASIETLRSAAPTVCLKSPADFTRSRKLSFTSVILQVLCFQNHSLQSEIFNFFKDLPSPATSSALIQQRLKIRKEAFDFLFDDFSKDIPLDKVFHGYRLLACDSSSLNLLRNPADENTSITGKPGSRSYNTVHINALYNLMNKVYLSYIIDDGMHMREADALEKMIRQVDCPEHVILTADRGYGSLNTVAA